MCDDDMLFRLEACHSSVIRDWYLISVGVERLECFRQISCWSTIWPGITAPLVQTGAWAILENHFWSGKGTKCSSQDSVNWTFGFLITFVASSTTICVKLLSLCTESEFLFLRRACCISPECRKSLYVQLWLDHRHPQVELQPSRTLNLNQGYKFGVLWTRFAQWNNITLEHKPRLKLSIGKSGPSSI